MGTGERHRAGVIHVLGLVVLLASAVAAGAPGARYLTYSEAQPALTAFAEWLPAELKGQPAAAIESMWPSWVARHDRAIRARLVSGDEDSLVNLLLFGVSFTKAPRVTEASMRSSGGDGRAVIDRRLADLVSGIAAPGTNERLRFARDVVTRKGFDPRSEAGRGRTRAFLLELLTRAVSDASQYDSAGPSAASTLFATRGLSSDTSIATCFGIDRALVAMWQGGLLRGRIRTVGVLGPGLDFADKAEGYDFYPQQTIQPFGVIDSLVRLGVAEAGMLRVATFDLSGRVNGHLAAARERASAGRQYRLHLPLSGDQPWSTELQNYWGRFGDSIGQPGTPAVAPPSAGNVKVRAIDVPPPTVLSIQPHDLDVVVERPTLTENDALDLVVATNVLVYYTPLEQALAQLNIAAVMRPGGWLLSNTALAVAPNGPLLAVGALDVPYADDGRTDRIYWYRHQ